MVTRYFFSTYSVRLPSNLRQSENGTNWMTPIGQSVVSLGSWEWLLLKNQNHYFWNPAFREMATQKPIPWSASLTVSRRLSRRYTIASASFTVCVVYKWQPRCYNNPCMYSILMENHQNRRESNWVGTSGKMALVMFYICSSLVCHSTWLVLVFTLDQSSYVIYWCFTDRILYTNLRRKWNTC